MDWVGPTSSSPASKRMVGGGLYSFWARAGGVRLDLTQQRQVVLDCLDHFYAAESKLFRCLFLF